MRKTSRARSSAMRDTTIDPIAVSRDLVESAARAPRLEVDEGHRPVGVTAQQALRSSAHRAPSSPRVVEMMDRTVARVLRVQSQPLVPREAVATPPPPVASPAGGAGASGAGRLLLHARRARVVGLADMGGH